MSSVKAKVRIDVDRSPTLLLSERTRRNRDALSKFWKPGQVKEAQEIYTEEVRRFQGEECIHTVERFQIMLACACLDRLVAYQPRPSVCRTVCSTQLQGRPREVPRLLRGAWIIEARQPYQGDRLFGDTIALASYYDECERESVLIGLRMIEGMQRESGLAAVWGEPYWEAEDMPASTGPSSSIPEIPRFFTCFQMASIEGEDFLVEDVSIPANKLEWYEQANRFATVFGLLLDAENSPLSIRDERSPASKKQPGRKPPRTPSWLLRHVYLSDAVTAKAQLHTGQPASASAPSSDRELAPVVVKGHLKRQRVGVGRQDLKWIYVSSYAAHRWVATQPTRVVVGAKDGET